jgi:hypothetical protein
MQILSTQKRRVVPAKMRVQMELRDKKKFEKSVSKCSLCQIPIYSLKNSPKCIPDFEKDPLEVVKI